MAQVPVTQISLSALPRAANRPKGAHTHLYVINPLIVLQNILAHLEEEKASEAIP
jgi:hypothetical protein